MYRAKIEDLALPAEELAALAEANAVGSLAETVMRVRAVTELSRKTSTTTLLALASIAGRDPERFADLVTAFGLPPH